MLLQSTWVDQFVRGRIHTQLSTASTTWRNCRYNNLGTYLEDQLILPRPLIVKRDVRDKFDANDSPIQQQLVTLKETLGLPVRLDVNWSLLWAEYERGSVDKAAFVPYIIPHVDALLSALSEKLDEDNSSWTDKFLELLTQSQELRLDLQVWLIVVFDLGY